MRIAMITQSVRHYTGGRYYAYEIAVALSELGHEVTVYTNVPILFERDFADYAQPRVSVGRFGYHEIGIADLYIGVPVLGVELACTLATRYKKPVWALIFDVLPLLQQSGRGDRSPALRQSFWGTMIQQVRRSGALAVCLARCNCAPCAEWMGLPPEQVTWVYPAVNDRVIEDVGTQERGLRAVWVSRIIPHKKLAHALEAVKPFDGLVLDVVCARGDARLAQRMGMADRVFWHERVSDREKFGLIVRAQMLIHSAIFEGFGMPPIEALACGTPVVCYRLPPLEEVLEDTPFPVFWAKRGDRWDLQRAVWEALASRSAGFVPDQRFAIRSMVERLRYLLELD